jgi:hypothetical protein
MRKPEAQVEHLVVMSAGVVAAVGSILNGVGEISEISGDLSFRIVSQRFGAGRVRSKPERISSRLQSGPEMSIGLQFSTPDHTRDFA